MGKMFMFCTKMIPENLIKGKRLGLTVLIDNEYWCIVFNCKSISLRAIFKNDLSLNNYIFEFINVLLSYCAAWRYSAVKWLLDAYKCLSLSISL